jgi:hypothetical protein
MTDENLDIEKAGNQLIAIGKAIEYSKVQDDQQLKQDGKNKNKELAIRFAKALEEIDKDSTIDHELEQSKSKSFFTKLLNGLKKYLLNEQSKENSEQENKFAKSNIKTAASEKSVKNLSAELEVAVARLKSVSTIDSNKNDMEITKAMEKVMSLSTELSNKIPANKSPDLEKAGIAIADVSVLFKNNSASVAKISEQGQSLTMAQEGIGDSTRTNINATTSNIRESFENQPTVDGDPKKTPITIEAKLAKEAAAAKFINPDVGRSRGE